MTVLRLFSAFLLVAPMVAFGFEGLVVTELPVGGDVIVPSEFPVKVPAKIDVSFSGVANPQALMFANATGATSVLKIAAEQDKNVRTITLKPGASAVYNFRGQTSVRVRVVSGDVRVSSLHPLKVQR